MKTIVIIGGSRGIGLAIAKQQAQKNNVVCLSRTKPDFENENIQFLTYNSLTDELHNLDKVD